MSREEELQKAIDYFSSHILGHKVTLSTSDFYGEGWVFWYDVDDELILATKSGDYTFQLDKLRDISKVKCVYQQPDYEGVFKAGICGVTHKPIESETKCRKCMAHQDIPNYPTLQKHLSKWWVPIK